MTSECWGKVLGFLWTIYKWWVMTGNSTIIAWMDQYLHQSPTFHPYKLCKCLNPQTLVPFQLHSMSSMNTIFVCSDHANAASLRLESCSTSQSYKTAKSRQGCFFHTDISWLKWVQGCLFQQSEWTNPINTCPSSVSFWIPKPTPL